MKNLKLAYKLGLSFGLLILIMVVQTGINGRYLKIMERNAQAQKEIYVASVARADQVAARFAKARVQLVLFGSDRDAAALRQGLLLLKDVATTLTGLLELVRNHSELADIQEQVQQLAGLVATYERSYKGMDQGEGLASAVRRAERIGDTIIDVNSAISSRAMENLITTATENHKVATVAGKMLVVSCLAGVALSILFAFLLTRMLREPFVRCAAFAEELARGNFSRTLDMQRKDEAGQLAAAMNNIVLNIGKLIRNIVQGTDTLASSSTELSAISEQVAAGARQTTGKAESVATAAEEMSANMNTVAAAVEEAATNVSIVATATDELTGAVQEIAKNTAKANTITATAVEDVRAASSKVSELGSAADEIGKVTETITEISDQTNLLALNATIEAARAGEAGKGFAVVANEIKELAKQTAEATGEIRSRIEGIQSSTQGTVAQITQISSVINEVNTIVSTIAAAVEEQTATTQEISINMSQATEGLQEVTENTAQSSMVAGEIARDILEVNQASSEMTIASEQVRESVTELSRLAEELRQLSSAFSV
ncbi:methyl-accepting chemotaxis protein [Desulfolithobacter sp.]